MIKTSSEQGNATKFIDRLAGRDSKQKLRLKQSQIHGCGVYAENQINCGDLIIEYIGEIIGNTVADKREKEYEKANLSDYFFRMDANTVCDYTIGECCSIHQRKLQPELLH
jgi:histone-lysine N-methyltransferase SETD1